MVNVYRFGEGWIYSGVTPVLAMEELRENWLTEPEGPQCFLVVDPEVQTVVAILDRDPSDPEICHTMFMDGRVEHHRCQGPGKVIELTMWPERLPSFPSREEEGKLVQDAWTPAEILAREG